ncbi:hypothetical protein [Actinomadura gamaensis]|uniref:Uncharacterized protein n=1 Tax=Actinomadura gamaensis TaxID=1763541 RepID=A0ABV9UCZ8_9ACTN
MTRRVQTRTPYDWLQNLTVELERLGVVGTLHNSPSGPLLAVVSQFDKSLDCEITCTAVDGATPVFWQQRRAAGGPDAEPVRRALPYGDPARAASWVARAVSDEPRLIARPDDAAAVSADAVTGQELPDAPVTGGRCGW